MRVIPKLRPGALLLLVAVLGASCPEGCPAGNPEGLAIISIDPSAITMEVGQTVSVRVTLGGTASLSESDLAHTDIVPRNEVLARVGNQQHGNENVQIGPVLVRYFITFDVTGVSPGTSQILVSNLSGGGINVAQALIPLRVVQGPRVVSITPTTLTLTPGQQARLTCVEQNAHTGVVVPATLVFSALNAQVATVGSDGTVTAIAAGSTDIFCDDPDPLISAAKAHITVIPPPDPPTTTELRGSYGISGPRLTGTCPAGTFASSVSGTAEAKVPEGDVNITLRSDLSLFGPYDIITGNWSGSAQSVITIAGTQYALVETVTGTWRRGPPVTLRATVVYDVRRADGSTFCQESFDATYSKL